MDKQIKDAFNQIHAPKDLIEDTKKKIHESETKKKYHWKTVTGIACTLAACAVVMVSGSNLLKSDNDSQTGQKDIVDITDFTEGAASLNGSDNDSIKEFEFEGTTELSEWHQVLENIDLKGNERIKLDKNYVIFTAKYPKEEEEYQIDIIIERGEIYSEHNELILQGNFTAEVSLDGEKLNKTSLNIISSSQFTKKDASLDMQDINQDGSMDFLLETAYNKNQEHTFVWYTLNEEYSVIESDVD